MKKLLLPTLAITSLMLGAACDMNKKTTRTTSVSDDTGLTSSRFNPGISESTDEVSTSASSTSALGDSAGSAAAGNALYNKDAAINKNTNESTSIKRSAQEEVARPALIETETPVIVEEPDYSEFERQSMEESEYQAYPGAIDAEDQLEKLEDEHAIFYGNPGASGVSGAPGTRDLEDIND